MTTQRFGDLIADMMLEQQRRIADLERAAGVSPTPGPLVSADDIRRELNLLWDRDTITKEWIGSDNKVRSEFIKFPLLPLYSRIFSADTPSLRINLPTGYNHLRIYCSGRSTGAGTGSVSLEATCNGDTGSNYGTQNLFAINTTITGQRNLANDHLTIGALGLDGNPENEIIASTCDFLHYAEDTLFTNTIMQCGWAGATDSIVMSLASTWRNISPVEYIDIAPTSGDIKEGTILSIYALGLLGVG